MKYRKRDVNVNVLINPGEDLLQLPLGRPQRVRHLPHRVRHPGRGAQQPRGVLPRGAPQYLPLFPLSHVQVKYGITTCLQYFVIITNRILKIDNTLEKIFFALFIVDAYCPG